MNTITILGCGAGSMAMAVDGVDRFREHFRYSGGWCSGCTGSLLSDAFGSVIMDAMSTADILRQEGLLLAQQQGSVARIWNLSSRNSERRVVVAFWGAFAPSVVAGDNNGAILEDTPPQRKAPAYRFTPHEARDRTKVFRKIGQPDSPQKRARFAAGRAGRSPR